MKQLVEKLQGLLQEKGKTLDLNGMELMEVLNLKATDLTELCEQFGYELYDIMYIETSTRYARELKKIFEFLNEVYAILILPI